MRQRELPARASVNERATALYYPRVHSRIRACRDRARVSKFLPREGCNTTRSIFREWPRIVVAVGLEIIEKPRHVTRLVSAFSLQTL